MHRLMLVPTEIVPRRSEGRVRGLVQWLRLRGDPIDCRCKACHFAASPTVSTRRGFLACVFSRRSSLLIYAHARFPAGMQAGFTPLLTFLCSGLAESYLMDEPEKRIKWMIENGACPNCVADDGTNALHALLGTGNSGETQNTEACLAVLLAACDKTKLQEKRRKARRAREQKAGCSTQQERAEVSECFAPNSARPTKQRACGTGPCCAARAGRGHAADAGV